MGKPKEKNDGSLPNSVVNNIYEWTPGGFILFYFNSQTGAPEQIMNFEEPAYCLALQKYVADWSEALHQFNLDNSMQNIQENIERSEDGDENS